MKLLAKGSIWKTWTVFFLLIYVCLSVADLSAAGGTRLLRQPSFNSSHIVFTYGGDVWLATLAKNQVRRLTSTPAVESDPCLSPDGRLVAFTSNRDGVNAVYTVPIEGGMPSRLTWYPASSEARGWTPDGKRVLYASTRASAPTSFNRLWTVSREGGPSTMVTRQMGFNGSYSPDGERLVIEPVSRWDVEWRA